MWADKHKKTRKGKKEDQQEDESIPLPTMTRAQKAEESNNKTERRSEGNKGAEQGYNPDHRQQLTTTNEGEKDEATSSNIPWKRRNPYLQEGEPLSDLAADGKKKEKEGAHQAPQDYAARGVKRWKHTEEAEEDSRGDRRGRRRIANSAAASAWGRHWNSA